VAVPQTGTTARDGDLLLDTQAIPAVISGTKGLLELHLLKFTSAPQASVAKLSRVVSIDYKISVTCHGKKSIETAAGDYGNVWLAFLAKARRHRSGAFRVLGRTGCVCCQFFTEVISAVTLCKISLT
jgi:hypothetical protein